MIFHFEWYRGKPKKPKKKYKEYQHEYYLRVTKPKRQRKRGKRMKLEINPGNKKYYSEDFIKGFECGVDRQYEEDKKNPPKKESEEENADSN